MPYHESQHSIRYTDLDEKRVEAIFIGDPFSETVPQKLVRYGLLEAKDISNSQKVAEAREKFIQKYGEEPENKIIHDDFEKEAYFGEFYLGGEQYTSKFVRSLFIETAEANSQKPTLFDLDAIYNPRYLVDEIKRWDMTANTPHLREAHIDVDLSLQKELVTLLSFAPSNSFDSSETGLESRAGRVPDLQRLLQELGSLG